MKYIVFLSLLISIFVVSCNDNTVAKIDTKEKLINVIDTLEYQIYKSNAALLDNRKPLQLVDAYKKFAGKYSQDSLSPKYLFKAAQMQVNLGNNMEAINTLDTLIYNFPKNKLIPSVLQFKAFIYDDRLGQINEARATLDKLINDFPESELVENAKEYKETLGKSPEEIIAELEAKAKLNKQINK